MGRSCIRIFLATKGNAKNFSKFRVSLMQHLPSQSKNTQKSTRASYQIINEPITPEVN
jgi:hypothetical protein